VGWRNGKAGGGDHAHSETAQAINAVRNYNRVFRHGRHGDEYMTNDLPMLQLHDDPAHALSDGPNALKLSLLPDFWRAVRAIDSLVRASRS
jgi:hypothetical protein